MLTEEIFIDRIELNPETGLVQIRQVTRIKRDGEVVASSYHRTSIERDANIDDQEPAVQSVIREFWK
jgi:hypothetical protein